MTKKSDTPAIRFKGFSDAWEQRKVQDVADRFDNLRIPVAANLRVHGTTPYYGANGIQDYVDGFTHDGEFVLVAEDGANDLKNYPVKCVNGRIWVNNHAHVLQGKARIADNSFLAFAISQSDIESLLVGGGRAKLNAETLMSIEFRLPCLQEQYRIGEYLSQLDNLITLHQRKFEKLTNVKKSMLEKMFPQNGSSYPEIRFKGFTDPWEQRKLGDMMNVTSVKRIHQTDWTDSGVRFLRARDIVAAAKNEAPDDYLYISKEKYEEYSALSGKVGVSDLLVTGVGTIGVPYLVRNLEPLYFKDGNIIWFQNSSKIDGKFLFYSFSAEQVQGFINESAGIGTVGTYTIESGKKTPISLPNQIEQARVGEFFQQLDNLITLHQRELEKLQNIKKSMLEKMFV